MYHKNKHGKIHLKKDKKGNEQILHKNYKNEWISHVLRQNHNYTAISFLSVTFSCLFSCSAEENA